MSKYTVILIPEYTAQNRTDVRVLHVFADDSKHAVYKAKVKFSEDFEEGPDPQYGAILAIFDGHLEDLYDGKS